MACLPVVVADADLIVSHGHRRASQPRSHAALPEDLRPEPETHLTFALRWIRRREAKQQSQRQVQYGACVPRGCRAWARAGTRIPEFKAEMLLLGVHRTGDLQQAMIGHRLARTIQITCFGASTQGCLSSKTTDCVAAQSHSNDFNGNDEVKARGDVSETTHYRSRCSDNTLYRCTQEAVLSGRSSQRPKHCTRRHASRSSGSLPSSVSKVSSESSWCQKSREQPFLCYFSRDMRMAFGTVTTLVRFGRHGHTLETPVNHCLRAYASQKSFTFLVYSALLSANLLASCSISAFSSFLRKGSISALLK